MEGEIDAEAWKKVRISAAAGVRVQRQHTQRTESDPADPRACTCRSASALPTRDLSPAPAGCQIVQNENRRALGFLTDCLRPVGVAAAHTPSHDAAHTGARTADPRCNTKARTATDERHAEVRTASPAAIKPRKLIDMHSPSQLSRNPPGGAVQVSSVSTPSRGNLKRHLRRCPTALAGREPGLVQPRWRRSLFPRRASARCSSCLREPEPVHDEAVCAPATLLPLSGMSHDELLYSQQQPPPHAGAANSSSPAGAGILQSQQQQALAALSHQKAVHHQQQHAQVQAQLQAQAQAQAQAVHAYAAMQAQQQAATAAAAAAAAAAAFGANPQYPSTAPATPHSHASPRSPVKVTPDTGNVAIQAGSPFATGAGGVPVASPAGSAFSAGASSAHEHAAMGMPADAAAYGRATGIALAGATGLAGSSPVKGASMMVSQSLGMDLDQSSGYGMPSMLSASGGTVTPGAGSAGSAGTPFAYPGTPVSTTASSHPAPSMASATRHHPYAHASRPSLHTQTSGSSIPLYFSSPSPGGNGAAPPTTPPPYGTVVEGGLGVSSTATSVAPQRVHSAPAHILTLPTQGLDGLGSPVGSAEPDSQGALDQRRFVGDFAQQQQQQQSQQSMPPPPTQQQQQQHRQPQPRDMSSSDSILHLSTNSAPASTPATVTTSSPAYQSGRPPSMKIDTAHASSSLSSSTAPQSAPATAMEDSRMTAPPVPASYNDKVSAALVLLQKRLPIMGAALSTSETESGQDEEEIWKGIEGAYDELKRIMVKRKDQRRRVSHGSSANMVSSRLFGSGQKGLLPRHDTDSYVDPGY